MKNFVKGKIKEVRFLGKDYLKLKIKLEDFDFACFPGQFFMLSLDFFDITFPRPFSILNYKKNSIEFLIKKVGKFTNKISNIKEGEKINLLGPLGNYFKEEEFVFLVAGGYGIAPIYFYLNKYKKLKNIKLFYGGKTKKDIIFYNDLKKILKENFYITTEDGKMGEKGLITDLLTKILKKEKPDLIYSCGPLPMFKKLNEICQNEGIKLYVSLDPIMACGYGICLGCVVPTNKGNLCACTEGPIFESNFIKWEKL